MERVLGWRHIYALADPDSLDVRYVGLAKSPLERLKFHMMEIGAHGKGDWILELRSRGEQPVLIPLALTPKAYAGQLEKVFIGLFRLGDTVNYNIHGASYFNPPHLETRNLNRYDYLQAPRV